MLPGPRRLLGNGNAPQALVLLGLVPWSHSQAVVSVHGLAKKEEAGPRDGCIRQHDCNIVQGSHVKLISTDKSRVASDNQGIASICVW